MYRLMRNVHLILGLALFAFLGVYLLSSVRVAQRGWFSGKPSVSEAVVPIATDQTGSPRQLGAYLMREHGLVGELFRIDQPKNGDWTLTIRRPGTNYRVRYRPEADEVQLKTTRQNWVGMLMSLHVAHGFWHDHWLINLWGALALLTSLGLFALGGTGIYLWFQTHEERKIGAVLLVVGLGYAFTTMYLVRALG